MKPKKGTTFEDLRPNLITLGFSYYGEPSLHSPDPEKTILEVCALMNEDRKTFKMLLCWVLEVKGLIHAERLKSLVELSQDLNQVTLLGVYIVLSRLIENGEKRFKVLKDLVKNQIDHESKDLSEFRATVADPYLIEKYGADEALAKLGIKSYKIEASDHKKVLSYKQILSQNLWLRMRVLVGTNYRADVLYLKSLNQFKTKYELWKELGSSQETAYRICNEVEILGDIRKISFKEKISA